MPELIVETKVSGRITDKTLPKDIEAKVADALVEIAELEGVQNVRDQLYPGHGYVTGRLFRSISSALTDSLRVQIDAGKHRYGKNLSYAAWVEGTSKKNVRASFKGYGMFQKTHNHLSQGKSVFAKHIKKAIADAV
jgi:hypothetical protein